MAVFTASDSMTKRETAPFTVRHGDGFRRELNILVVEGYIMRPSGVFSKHGVTPQKGASCALYTSSTVNPPYFRTTHKNTMRNHESLLGPEVARLARLHEHFSCLLRGGEHFIGNFNKAIFAVVWHSVLLVPATNSHHALSFLLSAYKHQVMCSQQEAPASHECSMLHETGNTSAVIFLRERILCPFTCS